jgi:hypothetical protein
MLRLFGLQVRDRHLRDTDLQVWFLVLVTAGRYGLLKMPSSQNSYYEIIDS